MSDDKQLSGMVVCERLQGELPHPQGALCINPRPASPTPEQPAQDGGNRCKHGIRAPWECKDCLYGEPSGSALAPPAQTQQGLSMERATSLWVLLNRSGMTSNKGIDLIMEVCGSAAPAQQGLSEEGIAAQTELEAIHDVVTGARPPEDFEPASGTLGAVIRALAAGGAPDRDALERLYEANTGLNSNGLPGALAQARAVLNIDKPSQWRSGEDALRDLFDLRQQVEDTIAAAQTEDDGEWITAYHFKTGAIHRLLAKARDIRPGQRSPLQTVTDKQSSPSAAPAQEPESLKALRAASPEGALREALEHAKRGRLKEAWCSVCQCGILIDPFVCESCSRLSWDEREDKRAECEPNFAALAGQPAREDGQKALRAAALERLAALVSRVPEMKRCYDRDGEWVALYVSDWNAIRALAGSPAGEGREDNQLGKKGGE